MSPRDPIATTTTVPRGARTRWWTIIWFVTCAALATAAVFAWRWYALPDRIAAGLPAPPDLTGQPPVLQERLLTAQALTSARRNALDGVAELGRLYHANGYRTEAEACWQILRAEQPREARWCYFLADLRRAASDYAGMESLLRRTVELAPDYAAAWLQLAGLHFKSGEADAAERAYRRRLALLPDDPHAGLGLARVALHHGRRDEARRLLEQIIRDVPEFPASHNLYAGMLAEDGDESGARHHRWLGREAGRFPDPDDPWLEGLHDWCFDPQRLRLFGTVAFQAGDGVRARELIERAVELAPDDPVGYALLGDLCLKLGDAAGARDSLEESLHLTTDNDVEPMVYVNLSHAYRVLQDANEALRVADAGLAHGDDFELHDARGVALGDLGRHEEAVRAFNEAIARNPNDANTNYNLGISLLALDRADDAYAALRRSLTLQPTFPKTLTLLGHLELAAGRLESAGQYVRPLYESHPGVPEARALMVQWHRRTGLAAAERGDHTSAAEHYRKGLAIDPEDAELNASLGVLYLVRGRVGDALELLETYNRLEPENPQSWLFLGQVYARLGRIGEARRVLTTGVVLAERAGNSTTAGHCREILRQL